MDDNTQQPPAPPTPPVSDPTTPGNGEDKLNIGLTILSFCIPLAGAIIYFVKKEKEPKSAKTACIAALIGVGVGIIINIIITIAGIGFNN